MKREGCSKEPMWKKYSDSLWLNSWIGWGGFTW